MKADTKKTLLIFLAMPLLMAGCTNKEAVLTPVEPSEAITLEAKDTEEAAAPSDSDSPRTDRDLFADFIMGKGPATVSPQYLSELHMLEDWLQPGDSVYVNDIREKVSEDEMIGQAEPTIAYAPVWCHNLKLYALRLSYELEVDAPVLTYILHEHDGKLEYVFGIDAWSRRNASVNEYGIVFEDGANGAGSHAYQAFAPDTEGMYHTLYDIDEECYGFSFYDDEGNPEEALNATMTEVGEECAGGEEIIYYREVIDGKTYYYFLGTGKLTQATVDEIDRIAASHDFTFDGKAAADGAREAYQQKLGVTDSVKSETPAPWKEPEEL